MTDGVWVLNPAFRVQDGELVNRAEGVRITLTPPLRELWERRAADLTREAESTLRRLRLIVPPAASAAAGAGLAQDASATAALPRGSRATSAPWGLIGAPVDLGGPPGARPKDAVPLIRDALARRFRALANPSAWSWALRAEPGDGLSGVVDHGDLLLDPQADTGVRVHERLRAFVSTVVAQNHRPLVIGGDHSVSYPAIGAVADRHPGLRVVHLDAHADRRPVGTSPTADCGNFVSWVLAERPDVRWLTIGVRGIDPAVDRADDRVTYLTADEAGAPDAAGRIERFCTGHPVYLTVDIDVLDPLYAPDVVYSSFGGLDPRTLAALVRAAVGPGRLVGADLVEACPAPTGPHLTAARLVDLVATIQLAEAGRALSEEDA